MRSIHVMRRVRTVHHVKNPTQEQERGSQMKVSIDKNEIIIEQVHCYPTDLLVAPQYAEQLHELQSKQILSILRTKELARFNKFTIEFYHTVTAHTITTSKLKTTAIVTNYVVEDTNNESNHQ